jgi:hypothetical protein
MNAANPKGTRASAKARAQISSLRDFEVTFMGSNYDLDDKAK